MLVIFFRLLFFFFSLFKILLMLELCIFGYVFRIFFFFFLVYIINVFIGFLIWGLFVLFFFFWERIILVLNIFFVKILNKILFKKYVGKWREKKKKELE